LIYPMTEEITITFVDNEDTVVVSLNEAARGPAGPAGDGGGASAFTDLTDKATAEIPTINTPLATALGLLAPKAGPTFTGTVTATTIYTTDISATNVTASTAFNGPGTGLTGTASGFTAGTANALASGTTITNATLVNPTLGTPASGNAQNLTGLPIDGGTSGTLPVSRGGTGTTNGSITGTGALTFTAGGTNQNVVIVPSGTGLLSITGSTNNTAIPVFRATNNYNGGTAPGYVNTFECLAPNLGVGNLAYAPIGVSASTNNRAGLGFYYAGSGSANNFMSLGNFFGGSGVFAVFPNGGAAIASSGAPTSPGAGSLSISGTLSVTGASTFGAITLSPASSATPASNGQLTFEATSNTSLTIKFKGSDGTVRSVVLTLA
jgi:hypothetical protein